MHMIYNTHVIQALNRIKDTTQGFLSALIMPLNAFICAEIQRITFSLSSAFSSCSSSAFLLLPTLLGSLIFCGFLKKRLNLLISWLLPNLPNSSHSETHLCSVVTCRNQATSEIIQYQVGASFCHFYSQILKRYACLNLNFLYLFIDVFFIAFIHV